MARKSKGTTAKSGVLISVIFHAVVILAVTFFAAREGMLGKKLQQLTATLVPKQKKPEPPKELPKPIEQPKEIVEEPVMPAPSDAPPPPLTAVKASANAPAAVGESFFTAAARPPDAKPVPLNVPLRNGGSGGVPGGTGTGGGSVSMFSTNATKPSTFASVLEERKTAVAAQDAISSEQIARSGASDAAAVVSKIAGASIVEGKFVVVRGLSDHYNITTLNGGDIPTADPYRKAAQLDLIPSTMIDRIVVNKTFTPDQPGGFAGGNVNVITKSFPAKAFATVTVGTEYNSQSSFNKDFLGYHGGSTDWAGMDDGTRSLPGALENTGIPGPPRNAPRNETPEQAAQRQAQADLLARLTGAFSSTQFAPTKAAPPLNQNFSIGLGDATTLLGRPFGVFAGLSYKREFNFYEDGVSARYDNALNLTKVWADSKGEEAVNWGAAVNLAWQPFPNHELSFGFIYNQNSQDIGRRRVGTDLTTGSPDLISDLNTIQFVERHLHTFQFKGRHSFPEWWDMQTDWLVSLSNTTQDEPDLRYFNYYHTADGGVFRFDNSLPEPRLPTRYFRNLEEDNLNAKLDHTIPFRLRNGLKGELKLGLYYSKSERAYQEQTFTYDSQNGFAGFTDPLDPNTFLNSSNLTYNTVVNSRGTNYIFPRYLTSEFGNSSYLGKQEIRAAYAMITLPLSMSLKLSGGARMESTELSIASSSAALTATDITIRQTDLLPAASLIWNPKNEIALRLSYSQTITRPTYREIAAVRSYDLPTDTLLDGNPNLQITSIDNYDARLEWFPHPGEVFAVSLFYKDIQKPIEKYSQNQEGTILTYINRDQAKLYGIELEARKNLGFIDPAFQHFGVGMNFSLIESEVKLTPAELANKQPLYPNTPKTRPLYDQSPYIFNADLNYDNPRTGTSASLVYTMAGPRIFFVNPAGPDIYEHPPTTLDFVLSQRIGRNLRIKFSAKNLLDPEYQVTYGDKPDKNVYTSYKRGRTFGISLSYDF